MTNDQRAAAAHGNVHLLRYPHEALEVAIAAAEGRGRRQRQSELGPKLAKAENDLRALQGRYERLLGQRDDLLRTAQAVQAQFNGRVIDSMGADEARQLLRAIAWVYGVER